LKDICERSLGGYIHDSEDNWDASAPVTISLSKKSDDDGGDNDDEDDDDKNCPPASSDP
jgi:hypothetical protein